MKFHPPDHQLRNVCRMSPWAFFFGGEYQKIFGGEGNLAIKTPGKSVKYVQVYH